MNAAASLFSADNPGVPALGLVQLWLHVGWGTLLAWLGGVVTYHLLANFMPDVGATLPALSFKVPL